MLLTTRACRARFDCMARRNAGTGAVGISRVSLDARGISLRVATSAPPELRFTASVKSKNALPA